MSAGQTEALARRLVACPHFHPMPGMLDVKGWRVAHVGGGTIEWHDTEWNSPVEPDRIMPALDDPATLGCIEHGLLPEAWSADVVVICDGPRSSPWRCAYRDANGLLQSIGARVWWTTKAEALVAALESAP